MHRLAGRDENREKKICEHLQFMHQTEGVSTLSLNSFIPKRRLHACEAGSERKVESTTEEAKRPDISLIQSP